MTAPEKRCKHLAKEEEIMDCLYGYKYSAKKTKILYGNKISGYKQYIFRCLAWLPFQKDVFLSLPQLVAACERFHPIRCCYSEKNAP